MSGRPNWEFKFLRRAVAEDEQVQLVGLVRIARRQPKFDFRSAAQPADQPAVRRLRPSRRRDGRAARPAGPGAARHPRRGRAAGRFPQDRRRAVPLPRGRPRRPRGRVLHPGPAGLLRNFVSQRGGGLLMLGGPDSFADGKYDRTPVGELLPVYLNRPTGGPAPTGRSGVSPGAHPRRLASALGPDCGRPRTRNRSGWPRCRVPDAQPRRARSSRGPWSWPRCSDAGGNVAPALVAQQFGKGHVGGPPDRRPLALGPAAREPRGERPRALLAADRPLAGRRRPQPRGSRRCAPRPTSTAPAVELAVRVRDAEYQPLDNAKVALKITLPDGDDLTLDAEPDGREAGAVRGDLRRQAARRLPRRRHRDRRPTAAPSASARPAGPPSPPPTSSPASSPTASS